MPKKQPVPSWEHWIPQKTASPVLVNDNHTCLLLHIYHLSRISEEYLVVMFNNRFLIFGLWEHWICQKTASPVLGTLECQKQPVRPS